MAKIQIIHPIMHSFVKICWCYLIICACVIKGQTPDDEILSFDTQLPSTINLTLIGTEFIQYAPYQEKYLQGLNQYKFSYNPDSIFGPKNWNEIFPKCNGTRQSPVNLNPKICTKGKFEKSLSYLRMEEVPQTVILENNGYTIEMSFDYKGQRPLLVGGPLKSIYVFEQIHFHWGMEKDSGTEHQMASRSFDLEMHIVHRNALYPNLTVAAEHKDGIVAIGLLVVTSNKGKNLKMLKNIDQLQFTNSTVKITGTPKGFRMADMVGNLKEKFISYRGSLTTPPCSESVLWFVARRVRMMSLKDIRNFRKVMNRSGNPLGPNFRPIQPSNNRTCVFV